MKSFLGIDVSKGYADFALLNEQKQPLIKSFQRWLHHDRGVQEKMASSMCTHKTS
jgi:hypothetical protein